MATFKLYNGQLELFYKEDEKSLYPVCKRSAKYVEGWGYCSKCPYDNVRLSITKKEEG
jgi:hypothetical protein